MLEFGTVESTGNSSNIIVQKVKVADFTVTYGEMRDWQKYADDIGIDLVLDIGRDFQPTMYIGGSFKVDEINNEIIGWGRAYKVKMLLDAIGLRVRLAEGTAVTDNKLPADAKDHMIGKEFLRLSYVSTKTKPDGSNRWKDWQDTAKLGDEDLLKDNFTKAVDDGYVKDFCHPVHSVNGSIENQHVEADLPL